MSVSQAKTSKSTHLRSDVGRYAMLPEWLLMTTVSDKAIRLFGLLASKYADREGVAYPSRSTLAKDLRLARAKTVDGPLRELEAVGAVIIQKRRGTSGTHLTSTYTLSFSCPVPVVLTPEATPPSPSGGTRVVPPRGLPGPARGTTLVPGEGQTLVPGEGHKPDKYLTRSTDPEKDTDPAAAGVCALGENGRDVDDPESVTSHLRAQFERVWAVYPRGAKKARAWVRFHKLAPTPAIVDHMLAALDDQKRRIWGGVDPRFIPHLSSWLEDQRWLDEEDTSPVSERELDEACAWRGRIHMGRCPHTPLHTRDQDIDCLKAIALRTREQSTHRWSA